MRRYSVHNSIGAAGLPARGWAEAAKARLEDEPSVDAVRVDVLEDQDEFERRTHGIELEVHLRGTDAEAAAALVQREFMQGLVDVIGDREVGWTAYAWEAVPDDPDR